MKRYIKPILVAFWCTLLAATGALAQSSYRVKPGDTLTVEVLEDPSLNRTVIVLPDGSINFPFAGEVQAGGRTVPNIRSQITSGIESNFASTPTVFVTVSSVLPSAEGPVVEAPTISIYFVGEINSPGERDIEPGTTFLQAISLSGGFTNFAATKRVQLRRTGADGIPKVYSINYRALSQGAQLTQDIVLADGDVILVPERRLFE